MPNFISKIVIAVLGLLSIGSFGYAYKSDGLLGGRTNDYWNAIGTYLTTSQPLGYDILINGTNKYLNFNTSNGSGGYGFRDNSGQIEFKNSGGSWQGIGLGGGGGGDSIWATSSNNLFVYTKTPSWQVVVGNSATSAPGYAFEVNGSSLLDDATFNNASGTGVTAANFWGSLIGTASSATGLAANGADCSAGNASLGIDIYGASAGCFDVWTEAENTAANYASGSAYFIDGAGSWGQLWFSDGSGRGIWRSTSSLGISGSGSGSVNLGSTGQIAWYSADGTAVSGTSSIFIQSNGNVGIGTTTGNYALNVNGPTAIGSGVEAMRITGGKVGISTTTPGYGLSIATSTILTGGLYDSLYTAGTWGSVLMTTGSGIKWTATTSLGIAGGAGTNYWTDGGDYLYPNTGADGLIVNGSTTLTAKLNFTNASGTGITATNFWGSLIGTASSATGLAANGADCSAGNAPLGVDIYGASAGCFDVWTEAENTAANYASGSSYFIDGAGSVGQLWSSDGSGRGVWKSTSSLDIGPDGLLNVDFGGFTCNGSSCSVDSDGDWTVHGNYPSPCSAGQYVSAIGDTLTCSSPAGSGSGTVGSGTIGQLAYYAADGTAVTGTSTIEIQDGNIVAAGWYYGNNAPGRFYLDAASDVSGGDVAFLGGSYQYSEVSYNGGAISIDGAWFDNGVVMGGDLSLKGGTATSSANHGRVKIRSGSSEERYAILSTGLLSGDRNFAFPDASGTLALSENVLSLADFFATTSKLNLSVGTATALSVNGSNCSSGNAPLGIDVNGNAESCFDVWTQAENTAAAYISDGNTNWDNTYNFITDLTASGSSFFIDGAGNWGSVWMSDGSGRGVWKATSTLGLGGTGGSGTVNTGAQGQVAWYASAGEAVTGTSSLYIDPNTGNVGVGTTTGSYALNVNGPVAMGSGNESMRISGGKVGIATTSYSNVLSVQGDIYASGDLKISGLVDGWDIASTAQYTINGVGGSGQFWMSDASGPGVWKTLADADIPDNITASNYLTLSAWAATTTDQLDEGINNLYWTTARFQNAFDGRLSATTTLPNLDLVSANIDGVCSTDDKILKRSGGSWACADDAVGAGGGGSSLTASTTPDFVIFKDGAGTYYAYNSTSTVTTSSGNFSTLLQATVDKLDNVGPGGIIFIKAGDYFSAATTTITGRGSTADYYNQKVTIRGAGIGATNIIIGGSTNSDFLHLTNWAVAEISDMTVFLSGRERAISSLGSAVGDRAFWQSSIHDLYITSTSTDHTGFGMVLGNPFRSKFDNIEFFDVGNCARFTAQDTTGSYGAFNAGDFTWTRTMCHLNGLGAVGFEFAANGNYGRINQANFDMVEVYGADTGDTAFKLGGQTYLNEFRGINIENVGTAFNFVAGSVMGASSNRIGTNYVYVLNNGTFASFGTNAEGNIVQIGELYNDGYLTMWDDNNTNANTPNILHNSKIGNDGSLNIDTPLTTTSIFQNIFGRNDGFTNATSTLGLNNFMVKGNFGIATTSYSIPLSVSGNAYISGNLAISGTVDGIDIATSAQYFIDGPGTWGQVWMSDGNGRGMWRATTSLGIVGGASGALDDLTDVTITAPGWGNMLMYNGSQWVNVATSTLGMGGVGGSGTVNSGSAGQVAWYASAGTSVNGTSTLYIDPTTGKVGIGTTTPQYALDVSGTVALGNGNEAMRIDANGYFAYGTTSGLGLGLTNNGNLYFTGYNRIIGFNGLAATSTPGFSGLSVNSANGALMAHIPVKEGGAASTSRQEAVAEPDIIWSAATANNLAVYTDNIQQMWQQTNVNNNTTAALRRRGFLSSATASVYGGAAGTTAQTITASTMYRNGALIKGIVTMNGYHVAFVSTSTGAFKSADIKIATSTIMNGFTTNASWSTSTIVGTQIINDAMLGIVGVARGAIWIATSTTQLIPFYPDFAANTWTAGTAVTVSGAGITLVNTRVNENGIYAGFGSAPYVRVHNFSGQVQNLKGHTYAAAVSTTGPDLFVMPYSLYGINGGTLGLQKIDF